MLQRTYTTVLESGNWEEFRGEVVRFSQQLGFDTVTAITVIDHPLAEPEFFAVDNAPAAYRDAMHTPENARRDPVMQHCKAQSVPIVWSQGTYTRQGLGELWEEQAQYGYRNGVCLALHMPEGRHFVLGVDREQAMPKDPSEITRIVADLQLFAVYAQDAALRIMVPAALQQERPALTPRELECLRRTMDGMTAWEVGEALAISERTAVLHLSNAMHKLHCKDKHQAVLKALRLGLIR
ncbi:MAG: autoinducer binding domain-containing protein [Burkholderiaceae bacterium]|nr:autoinducer binding domain-containing protein [Burkholderiaceae bacterium]